MNKRPWAGITPWRDPQGNDGREGQETLDPCFRRGDDLSSTEPPNRHSCESRNPGFVGAGLIKSSLTRKGRNNRTVGASPGLRRGDGLALFISSPAYCGRRMRRPYPAPPSSRRRNHALGVVARWTKRSTRILWSRSGCGRIKIWGRSVAWDCTISWTIAPLI
jgi:hypothetical protein